MEEIKLDKRCYDMFIFRGVLALECYFDIDNNKGKCTLNYINDFAKI